MSLQKVFQGGYKNNNVTSVTLVSDTAKTIDTSPGAGKRWLLLGIKAVNLDNVARNVSFRHNDVSDNELSFLSLAAQGNGTIQVWPNNDDLAWSYGNASHLRIVEDGEYIRVLWAAGGASAGGTDADGLVVEVMEIVKGSA